MDDGKKDEGNGRCRIIKKWQTDDEEGSKGKNKKIRDDKE